MMGCHEEEMRGLRDASPERSLRYGPCGAMGEDVHMQQTNARCWSLRLWGGWETELAIEKLLTRKKLLCIRYSFPIANA